MQTFATAQDYIDQVVIPALGDYFQEYDLQAIAAECTAWTIKKSELVEIATIQEFYAVVRSHWLPAIAYITEFNIDEPNEAKLAYEASRYFVKVIDSEEAEEYESPFLVLAHPHDEALAFVYRSDKA